MNEMRPDFLNDLDPTLLAALCVPFVAFCALLLLARFELGSRGILIAIAAWIGMFVGCIILGLSLFYFLSAQAVLDIILVLIVFGGDFTIT